MPYIAEHLRESLEPLANRTTRHPGELNFQLTKVCLQYLKDRGGTDYQGINDIVGALECAKQEFYRRLAAPYEDTKIATNGDVYP